MMEKSRRKLASLCCMLPSLPPLTLFLFCLLLSCRHTAFADSSAASLSPGSPPVSPPSALPPLPAKKAKVNDDPHFTGAHGTRFDFNGELDKAFCLLTDRGLHLNALLKGYRSNNTFGATVGKDGKGVRSWIEEVGLIWSDSHKNKHTLHLVARKGKGNERGEGFLSAILFDETPAPLPQHPGEVVVDRADLTFLYLGTGHKGWYDIDKFRILIGERLDIALEMRPAHPQLQLPDQAEVHFNILINQANVTKAVHGVLGQTYRNTAKQIQKALKFSTLNHLLGGPVKADAKSGAGFLEGSVKDYESSDVLQPDCKMSAFQ